MPRPFLRYSIEDLEAAFTQYRSNTVYLHALKEELKYRNTKRAAELQAAVWARIRELEARCMAEPTTTRVPSRPSPAKTASQGIEEVTARENSRTQRVPVRSGPDACDDARSGGGQPPLPPITNSPDKILSAWTALEVLAPQSFVRPEDLAGGDRRAVATLEGPILPWERGEKSRPNYRLYYQVVLGSIKMASAIERLIERFGDARPERPTVRGQAALAVVIVDQQGGLVQSPAIAVSSFGWGVMTALEGELTDLARWPEVEPDLVRSLERQLLGVEGGGEDEEERRSNPLTHSALLAAYQTLLDVTGVPGEMAEPPQFAIRSYEYFKSPNPPEPLLLNSFFLADLALGRSLFVAGKAPQNLRRYLRQVPPQNRRDLLQERAALEEAVAPSVTNLARWPGPGRHPLVLLQQAGINLAFCETKNGGILGINGPPGTGKTTLLRDLVAGVVTARAEAMTKFADPETAFTHSGEKLKAGEAWLHLYCLDPALRGFEMVVASSNNKAVENVSAELPDLRSIASDASDLRYFKTLSDALHQRETWGIIAAVLGNALNRSCFRQTFWWNEDVGLNAYLTVATGGIRQIEEKNPITGKIEYRLPRIVAAEKPPASHEEALERWRDARDQFLAALEKSRTWQKWLESLRADLSKLPALVAEANSAQRDRQRASMRENDATAAQQQARRAQTEARIQLQSAEDALHQHDQTKPGFLARLFRTKSAREWGEKRTALAAACGDARAESAQKQSELTLKEEELRHAKDAHQRAEACWTTAMQARTRAEQRLDEARQKYEAVLADTAFFARDHGCKHQAVPWFPAQAQRVRDDLFTAAMNLHRAFIDAAAKPLRHNLGAFMNALSGQALPGAAKEGLLSDLWATLFLIVPLVSTTFASVGRMLGKLPPESLGWLLVDEAGQALPQAAVGALIRARKVLMVGDPVQIEPVVILPDTLTHAICRRFGVDPDSFGAPSASAQTLADAASAYMGEFQTKVGSRTVGVPLLVHRRCAEPMFSISNAIAYAGQMVTAKQPKPSPIRDVLGPSAWIHVEGSAEDKWCAREGAEVIRLLRELAAVRVAPDLYIVTPFVIVADRLRQVVRNSGVLAGWIEGVDDWKWTTDRIGTVHTVQGREAEAVIFVLGAPAPAQARARDWAGRKPNLLNVAVTRAKEVLYVVGNRALWREAGLFRELDARLPP